MIVDRLDNAAAYEGMGPRIRRAFEYLRGNDPAALAAGKHEIEGTAIYASVQDYSTKPAGQGRWEAHRRYIDLQYIARGVERIGYAPLGRMTQGDYDGARDMLALSGEGDTVTLSAGMFMLLFPEDAHMPGLACGAPAPVRKVVVKIAVS
jgi:YhcH/YjgK/YiaL family protein